MLYITETDVADLYSMKDAIQSLKNIFTLQAEGKVRILPRSRIQTDKGTLNVMASTSDELGYSCVKTYYGSRSGARFIVVLFSTRDGNAVATIEASRLGQIRTGAATAVATDLLSKPGSEILGCVGTGYQATSQVEGVCAVRKIREVYVRGRNPQKAHEFAEYISTHYGVTAHAASDNSLFEGADIIICATTSKSPVIEDRYIGNECHINAIGANRFNATELQKETVCSASTVVVDSVEQAKIESGDIAQAINDGCLTESEINELWMGFSGGFKNRNKAPTRRTIFKSLGVAQEDLAAAAYVYEKANRLGYGRML
ncbi:MAG: ornithine cyclodeaminase family protein [Methanomassiliicoccales archaeon]